MKNHLSLLLVLFSFCGISQVHVVTNLNDSGPNSLRGHVINASGGDTIRFSPNLLANGSDTLKLFFPISFTVGVTVEGLMMGGDTLYISGQDSTQIFYMDLSVSSNDEIHLRDLAIIKAKHQSSDGDIVTSHGGAIYARGMSELNIQNCLFRDCNALGEASGGAIYARETDLRIGGSRFEDNSSCVANSSFFGRGGAVCIWFGELIVRDCIFRRNESGDSGGAIWIIGKRSKIEDSFFEGNDTEVWGGALYLVNDSSSSVCDNLFVGNSSNSSAGAIYVGGSSPSPLIPGLIVDRCYFISNEANSTGGSILMYFDNYLVVTNSSFVRNKAHFAGGVLSNTEGRMEIGECTFFDCDAPNGSLYSAGSVAFVDFENCTMYHSFNSGNSSLFHVPFSGPVPSGLKSSIVFCDSTSINSGFSVFTNESTWTSNGHNIFSNSPSFAVATDQVNIDSTQLNLEPLADNGGFAPTRVPGLGSVALNMGTPTDFSPAQNGPIYGRRDIGAAEARTIISDTLLACSPINWWGNTYSTAGTYTDTVFNANSIDSVGILVLERQDTTIINQNAVLLALEDDANTTYQWVDCDNGYAPIAGETSMSFTPATNGNYAVILSNGTCSDTSDCILYDEVSVAEENGQPNLRYYPNPTQGKLTIATLGELPNHVSILDLSGRPVGQLELESNTIQLPEFKAGMYILQWKWASGRTATSRVVVQ